jgi:hypothetical protein
MNYDPPEERVPHNWPFPTYYGKPIVKQEPPPEDPAEKVEEALF